MTATKFAWARSRFASISAPDVRCRFQLVRRLAPSEARLVARLEHPKLVPNDDTDDVGAPSRVTKFIRGETLTASLARLDQVVAWTAKTPLGWGRLVIGRRRTLALAALRRYYVTGAAHETGVDQSAGDFLEQPVAANPVGDVPIRARQGYPSFFGGGQGAVGCHPSGQ